MCDYILTLYPGSVCLWDASGTIYSWLFFFCYSNLFNSAGGFRAESESKTQHVRVSLKSTNTFNSNLLMRNIFQTYTSWLICLCSVHCSSSCSLETSPSPQRVGLPPRFHSNHINPHPFGAVAANQKRPPPPLCFHGNVVICGPLPKDDQLPWFHPVTWLSRTMTLGWRRPWGMR